mmetsp:Transcript_12869/g.46246  ORF Transcript_12869/g.46246 Transcript_12869/m.46246 type:complete len:201 (-) Transcript_12869:416-1018(-)
MPSAVGCSTSRMRSGRIDAPSSERNAEAQSTNATTPPLPRASAFKRALTSSIAAVCAPGCAYLDDGDEFFLLSPSRRTPRGSSAYDAASPAAGGIELRPFAGPLGKIPVSSTRVPGSVCRISRTTARIPRNVSAGPSLSRPRLFVPTHRTTTPGGCRKLSSPSRILRSTFCVRSPLIPNALASFSGNHFSNTARLPASSS